MFGTVIDKARFGLALARGREVPPGVVDRLVRAAGQTFSAHGAPPLVSATAALSDAAPAADLLRDTVRYAKESTRYWASALAQAELASTDCSALSAVVPITTTADLAEGGVDMVAAEVPAVLCAQTTGTTGVPLRVPFSQSDVAALIATTGVAAGLSGAIRPGDHVQISTGSRDVLGNMVFSNASTLLGAQVLATGQISARSVLDTLRTWPATVLLVWPSFLGAIVTAAERAGHGPGDFALRSINVGGELVTTALLKRARAVFGEHVAIVEGYGCTETLPVAGISCEQGHLHLDSGSGHVEFVKLDRDEPAEQSELARLVVTPYSFYRRAMPMLRYDAGDIVAFNLGHSCSRAANPAVLVHGKRAHLARTECGVITARHLLDAVESTPDIALPVRCGPTRSTGGGLDVEVVGPVDVDAIGKACRDSGLPVEHVRQVSQLAELRHPIRRRADLIEAEHSPTQHDDAERFVG